MTSPIRESINSSRRNTPGRFFSDTLKMLCQIPSWIATFSPKWQTDSEQEGLFSETKQPSYEPDDSIEKISWNYFDFLNNILQILLLNSRAISHFHNGHLLRQLNGHPICLWSYWTPSIPLFPFQEKVLSFFGNTIQIRKLDLIHIFKSYCLFFCEKKPLFAT